MSISFIIITYNTKELVQECVNILLKETEGMDKQVIVVDNGSNDRTYPALRSIAGIEPVRIEKNVGFGAANNIGYQHARGKYIALLNSDAFPHSGAIEEALQLMETNPEVGLMGGRLVYKDGSWQPSAHLFPSLLNQFLKYSGLAHRYPDHPFFGRANRSWADPEQPAEVDWIPGAFCVIRREALEKTFIFDEKFFMYYEEVDLCKRIKDKGWKIVYWPDAVITHIGGETTKNTNGAFFNQIGAQVSAWEARSCYLYFRKYGGWFNTWSLYLFQVWFSRLRWIKNLITRGRSHENTRFLVQHIANLKQAWKDTRHGTISPPRPWV